MKKTLVAITAVVTLILAFTSCRKNDKLVDTLDTANGIRAANQSQVQLFTVNVGTGGTITGTGGSKITFPPNFARNTDNSVFTGDAVVALRESLRKNNWIADGLSATTQTEPLVSGGMINLEVSRKDNGQALVEAPAMRVPAANANNLGAVIRAEVPRLNDAGQLNLFLPDTVGRNAQGGQGPAVSAPGAPVLAWQNASYYPFGNSPNSYIFQLPKFGWANCDRLSGIAGPKTTLTITPNMSAHAGATDLQAMLVYASGLNMVITLVPQSNGTFQSYNNSIPLSTVADVVLIGKAADGKILFKVLKTQSFTANQNITIAPDVTSGATVQTYLNSVN